MTKIRKEQSVKSFRGREFIKTNDMLLMDIVYLDGKLCVIRVRNNNRINNILDTVLCYYKRTIRGFEKIFDLNVPNTLPSSSSSESSEPSSFDSLDEDDDDDTKLNTINWADEIGDEDICNANVPYWARIEGLDFFENMGDTTDLSQQSVEGDLNKNNINWAIHQTSEKPENISSWEKFEECEQHDEISTASAHINTSTSVSDNKSDIILVHEDSILSSDEPSFVVTNWADEVCEMDTSDIEIPDWARIPGLDFSPEPNDTNTSMYTTSDNEGIIVVNWADEAYDVNLEDVNVPEWAMIPGLDFKKEINDSTTSSFPDSMNVRIFNWADKEYEGNIDDVDIPEWAKIPGIDFKEHNDTPVCSSPENLNMGIVNWADEVYDSDVKDVDVPDWAKIPGLDFDIESAASIQSDRATCIYDETDAIVSDWALVDEDMNSVYFNLHRLNNRSYFLEEAFGLQTIWE